MASTHHSSKEEGGWGWLVVFAAFIVNFITDGIQDSYGVLLSTLVDELKASRSKAAWIGSVLYGAPLLCGPIASFVTNRIGYRKATMAGGLITGIGLTSAAFVKSMNGVIITYGVIAGIGLSLPYLSSIVIVTRYFERKRTLATGIAECGAGVGTFVMSPLLEFLIDKYGWKGAVIVVGGLALNLIVCGAIYRPLSGLVPKKQTETSSVEQNKNVFSESDVSITDTRHLGDDTKYDEKRLQQAKHLSYISILKNKAFLLLTVSIIIYAFGIAVPHIFIVDRAKLLHISEFRAGFLLSAIGITNLLGNVLYGFLGDYEEVNRILLLGLSLLMSALVLCLIPLFTTFVPLLTLCGLYGLLISSDSALTAVIILDFIGFEKLDDALGVLFLLQGVAISTGPPVAGWLYDITGSYDNTYYCAGCLIAVSGMILIAIFLCNMKTNPSIKILLKFKYLLTFTVFPAKQQIINFEMKQI